MSLSEKIKGNNNKTEQNKAKYDLDKQTAKISAPSSENVSKYEFLTGKDVLAKKDLLEKAVTMRRFEYPSLCKELKARTDITKKQYQGLNKIFRSDGKEELTFKTYNKSDPICNSKYSFHKYYHDSKKFNNFSFKSKYSSLFNFFRDLNKFNKLKTQKEKNRKEKKKCAW